MITGKPSLGTTNFQSFSGHISPLFTPFFFLLFPSVLPCSLSSILIFIISIIIMLHYHLLSSVMSTLHPFCEVHFQGIWLLLFPVQGTFLPHFLSAHTITHFTPPSPHNLPIYMSTFHSLWTSTLKREAERFFKTLRYPTTTLHGTATQTTMTSMCGNDLERCSQETIK